MVFGNVKSLINFSNCSSYNFFINAFVEVDVEMVRGVDIKMLVSMTNDLFDVLLYW